MTVKITQIQLEILNALSFAESFETLLEEVNASRPVIGAELKTLIDKGWVQVMEMDPQTDRFRKTIFHDADDLSAYHYLISARGLEVRH